MTRRAVLLLVPAFMLALLLAEARAADDENPVVALIKAKVKDTSKPFSLLVTFKVKEGKEKDFEAALRTCRVATKKEPGCVAYELNRDPDEARTYVMYEQFKSLAAVQEHIKAKHTEELFKQITPILDGELKVKVYQIPE